jgi:anthranilate synthase component 1
MTGLGLPDMAFVITETLVIFDHRFRKLQVVANLRTDDFPDAATAYAAARERIDGLIELLRKPRTFSPFPLMTEPPESPVRSNTTREEYEGMVLKAKEYILAGDIFQVVPSQRFENDYTGRPIDLYRALRHVNPSPYMFCLQFGDEFALVGSSPEVHVQAIDGRIASVPSPARAGGAKRRRKMMPSPPNSSPIRKSAPSTSCSSISPAMTSGASPNMAPSR